MNRKPLSDRQWSVIEPLLKTDRSKGGRPPKDSRMVLDAILWIHRTGSPWRDVPAGYGPWQSIYTRFSRWSKSDIWPRLLASLSADRDAESYLIDSTIVRAHQHAAGAKKSRAKTRRSAAPAAASPARSMSSSTRSAIRSTCA